MWWALKTLFDKELLYRGHKILPYCPRCGTALSSHELAQGYEDVEDPSVYIALDAAGRGARGACDDAARRILVWTTTPWTLVSNTALAVHPDLDYVELIATRGRARIRERSSSPNRACGAVLGEDYEKRWERGRVACGARSSSGMRYERPFDWLDVSRTGTNHEIIVGEDFVSADDGSGVVHMSPAFGADDYAAGRRHNLAFLQPVGARGEFPASMPVVGGLFVKDADAAADRGAEAARRAVEGRHGSRTRIRTAGDAARR